MRNAAVKKGTARPPDDREDSIAECLDPGSWHFADPENSGKTFLQTFVVFSRMQFGQCCGWVGKRYRGADP
jgi:hypothetical protein